MHEHQAPWFALRVRYRSENLSSTFLRQVGLAVCSPTYTVERRWTDRTKQLDLPLFPGYIFCQMAPECCTTVLGTPGVVQIVGMGRTPIPVEPSEMEGVLRTVQYGLRAEPAELPKAGDRVLIEYGPFCGLEGVMLERKSRQRIILSVTLLQRAISVELDESAVLPVKAKQFVAGVRALALP